MFPAPVSDLFDIVLLYPMVNFLVLLNNLLFGSFGLALIAFTVLIKLATFPLTLRQLHSTRAMQTIQPKVAELNKKFSDPKRRQEETMKLYREAGVNPLGCLGPMLLQFPVLIALYGAIRIVLPESPEALERLSGRLYSWSFIQHGVPIQDHFLGLDLRASGNLVLVVLVGLTTYLQTKTTVTPTTDEKQAAQQQMMAYMLPLMFGFFALSFPAGVSLYWIVSAMVQIVMNILTYGVPKLPKLPGLPQSIPPVFGRKLRPATGALSVADASVGRGSDSPASSPSTQPVRELRTRNGPSRSQRQNRRRRP